MQSVVILITYAALHVTSGLPLAEDLSHRIFMPGDLPVIYDVGSGSVDGAAYNSDISTNNDYASLVEEPPLLPSVTSDVGGVKCGLSYGSTVINGTCSRFLTKAHCSEGEWLIKKNNSDEGECAPRRCPAGELYFEGNCVNITDNSSCGEAQMFYVELTGNVHCDCEPDYFYDPWRGQCFTQHDQGSCKFGKYLEVTEEGGVKCVPNPCQMEGYKLNKKTAKCYRKQYRGICKHPNVVAYHSESRKVECITPALHTIFDTPTMRACPRGSYRDFSRLCREQYRVPTETLFVASYGTCNGNFVKDFRGICRKTHKLFG